MHDAQSHPTQAYQLLKLADQQLVRAERDIHAALDWSWTHQHPPSAASIMYKAASLDLLGMHMRIRSARKLVKVRGVPDY